MGHENENGPSETDIRLFQKVKETLGADFENDLMACEDDISRVRLFKKSFEWRPTLDLNGNCAPLEKSGDYSTRLREAANEHYKNKNLQQALHGFNLAINYAPIPGNSSEKSEQISSSSDFALGLAFANRSAVWTNLSNFQNALRDIQMALKYGYPVHLVPKLENRRRICEENLRQDQDESKTVKETAQKLKKYKEEILFQVQNPNPKCRAAEDFVEIQVHPFKGRQLVVTKDVPPGTTLIVEDAFVKVLQKEFKWDLKHCHFCFKQISVGVPCPGCIFATYCDETCRSAASEAYHSLECPCMKFLHVSKTCSYTRMAFRIVCTLGPQKIYQMFVSGQAELIRSKNAAILGSEPESGHYDSSSYLPIYHLISHTATQTPVENFANTLKGIIFAQVLAEFTPFYAEIPENERSAFQDFVASLILHHLEQVICNAISLGDYTTAGTGTGSQSSQNLTEFGGAIYPLCSLLNHSCFPTTTRIHDLAKGTMAIVSTMNLQKGQELTTSYSKIFHQSERKDRRDYLEQNFNFVCDCWPCSENWPLLTELNETGLPEFCCSTCLRSRSESCSNSGENPWTLSKTFALDEKGFCKNCGSTHNVSKLETDFGFQLEYFNEATRLLEDNCPVEAFELLKSFLQFVQLNLVFPIRALVLGQSSLKQALDLIALSPNVSRSLEV